MFESNFSFKRLWDVPEPFEYLHVENDDGSIHLSKRRCDDGRIVDFLENGDKIVTFPNGMKKYIHHFARSQTVIFDNGDVKKTEADGTTHYHYASTDTKQITYQNGDEVFFYKNGQVELMKIS